METRDPAKYWEERLARGATIENVGYRGMGRYYNQWMYRLRRRLFLQRAGAALRAGGIDVSRARILDVGSGSGFYIECWLELGAGNVEGVDITHAAVDALSQRFPQLRFRQADIGAAPVAPDASYDVVSCMDVLFHIVDDARYAAALAHISGMLRRGGLFMLTENCLHGQTLRSEFQTSRSLAEIEDLLARSGLELISRTPVFVLMNAPVDSRSRALRWYWEAMRRTASRAEAAGFAAGAALYALEYPLTRLLREGPSTEMLICRKR